MSFILQSENLWQNKPFDPDTAYASVSFLSSFLDWLETHGIDPKAVLANTGFTLTDLRNPETRLNYNHYKILMTNAYALWGSSDMGLVYGQELNFGTFGIVGHASITAPTLRDSIEIFVKYFVLKSRYVHLTVSYNKGELTYTYNSPLPDAAFRRFHLDAGISGVRNLIQRLQAKNDSSHAFVSHDGGDYRSAYRAAFPDGIEFNAPTTSITFTGIDVNEPSIFANPISSQLGLRYCEIEYQAQKQSGFITSKSGFDLIGKVQGLVARRIGDPPSIAEVAGLLAMSERSLRRAIADFGMTYRQILSDIRAGMAAHRLASTEDQIGAIAQDLGYENAANFSRAFKKWHGVSPLAFRRRSKQSPD